MNGLGKMRVTIFALCLLLLFLSIGVSPACSSPSEDLSIHGTVVDAKTRLPISEATVLMVDLVTSEAPKPGAGIYVTDSEGRYNASAPYVIRGHVYYVCAYRGNLTAMTFDYVPSNPQKVTMGTESENASFELVPGAVLIMNGSIYYVESASVSPERFFYDVIDPSTGKPPAVDNTSYLSTYGDSREMWFLAYPLIEQEEEFERFKTLVVVPADTPVDIKVEAWFYSTQRGVFSFTFVIDNRTKHFTLQQRESYEVDIGESSSLQSFNVADKFVEDVKVMVDEMQRDGFYVLNERDSLSKARSKIQEAQGYISAKNYFKAWETLREAYATAQSVYLTLGTMRTIATSDSVRLPPFFAVYAVSLAFFIFEDDKKKLISSLIIYVVFLVSLFWIYPGTQLIVRKNMALFLESSAASILVTLAIVFGLPRFWKEAPVGGRVTLKSVTTLLFSMAKRQIKRRRLRSFFTIASLLILVFVFTSLTSFGAVYGIISETLPKSAPADGVLVKRPGSLPETYIPLGLRDLEAFSQFPELTLMAPKVENSPRAETDPIGDLRTFGDQPRSLPIYGILGIAPENETTFTHIDEIVELGGYLQGKSTDAILISVEAASKLDLGVNGIVQFFVSGISIPITNFTITGLFNDTKYEGLTDLDSGPLGPKQIRVEEEGAKTVPCNGTSIVIMHWRTAMDLYEKASKMGEELDIVVPLFAQISRAAFLSTTGNFEPVIQRLVFVYDCKVFVSVNNKITSYYRGYRYEAKGAAEIFIPIVMVALNVGAVELNAVYERRREMGTLTLVGLHPDHIAALFIGEALILGLVAGGIGYLFGLGFYRIMVFFGKGLMTRGKLEWWWSVIGLALALVTSVLAALRPAVIAVKLYTPSMVKRIKISTKERQHRREDVFKAFQASEWSMRTKILEGEELFFYGYFISRLREMETAIEEKTEEIEELPEVEIEDGTRIKRIKFKYVTQVAEKEKATVNELVCSKELKEGFWRVILRCSPAVPGTPMDWIDRTIAFTRDIIMDWDKKKKQIMGVK